MRSPQAPIRPSGVAGRLFATCRRTIDRLLGDTRTRRRLRRPLVVEPLEERALLYALGTFFDVDGDRFVVNFSGPGTAQLTLGDPGGGGAIKQIVLTDTTLASSLSVVVTKAATGDGEVSLGGVTGNGSLGSLVAAKSDLVGAGLAFAGVVGSIALDDVLNGADLVVGGAATNATRFTLGDVGDGTEIRSGATIAALTVQSFHGDLIQAPAVTTLIVNTGAFDGDLDVAGAINTIIVKAGGASGNWSAARFGTVSLSGDFSGALLSKASQAQLGATAALASWALTGGNLLGSISAAGKIGTVRVARNASGAGGSVIGGTVSAAAVDNVIVDVDLTNSNLVAGANLGADGRLGGTAADADQFLAGKFGNVTVRRNVTNSVIAAGMDPLDGVINNDNEGVVGGNGSSINVLNVGGVADADSLFVAGAFKGAVRINNAIAVPGNDARFLVGGGTNVLELTRTFVTAASGGTIVLPGGSSLAIPAGLLDADRFATLARVSTMPVKPPGGIFKDVGSSVLLSFSAPSAVAPLASTFDAPTSAFADGPTADPTIGLDLKLGPSPITGLAGSVAVADIVDSVAGHHFVAIPSQVDSSNPQNVHIDLPASTIMAVNGNVASTSLRLGMMNLSLVNPLLKPQPVSPYMYWNGGSFQPFPAAGLPGGFKPTGKTLVVVHGMNSTVAGAFGDCVNEYKREYGYGQVVGFNYDWTQRIQESGDKFAEFLNVLKSRGITNVDVVAHSEGVPVALAGASRTDISDIGIGKFIGLGGPVMGTPVAAEGLSIATALLYQLSTHVAFSPLALVAVSTIQDLLVRGFAQDLVPGSAALQTIRDRFAATRSGTELNLLAGNKASGALSYFTGPIFRALGQENDFIINTDSALAESWNPATGLQIRRLGTLPLSHIELECDPSAVSRITNDVYPRYLSVGDVTKFEGNGGTTNFTFAVTLSRAPTKTAVSVDFATSSGTADSITDYLPNGGRLTFNPGQTVKTVTVGVKGDTAIEFDETFFLDLNNPTAGTLLSKGRATATILNDDSPRLSIGDVQVWEGDSGTTAAEFDVSLSAPALVDVTFTYATLLTGSATSNVDYVPAANVSVTIPAGRTHASVSVDVQGDALREANETFVVKLADVRNAIVADGQAVGTILDDDIATPNTTGRWVGPATLTNPLGSQTYTFDMRLQAFPSFTTVVTGTISSAGETRNLVGTVSKTDVVLNVSTSYPFVIYQLVGKLKTSTRMEGTVTIVDAGGGTTSGPFTFIKVS